MRSILVSVALCAAIPAFAAEIPPEISTFAYPGGVSYQALPFDYEAMSKPPVQPAPQSTPATTTEAPARPVLSRTELCSAVAFEAANNKLPIRFFANLIEQESNFRSHVVSHAGAQGIAQFMPGTAAEVGLNDPFEPIQALGKSAKFLAYLLDRFGNLGLAAAAYNAGPQRVTDWLAKQGGMPAETQHYVRRITGIPVEQWARQDSKGEEIKLPPYAECPQFHRAGYNDLVNTKIVPSEGKVTRLAGRRGRARYVRSRLSTLTYVTLSPSISSSPRMRLATAR